MTMDMPIHLKTLPPEALDILRFYGGHADNIARADEIMDGSGLNERRFGVALRRLVTKGYLVMDGYQTYRLSESGRRAANDLREYEIAVPPGSQTASSRLITRRMIIVTPRMLLTGQPTNVFVGFDAPDDEDVIAQPLNLLVRMQVLNGGADLSPNKDSSLLLDNKPVRQVFEVSAGAFTKTRLRCYVYQTGDEDDVPEIVGGMYVDLNVVAQPEYADRALTAYGVDLQFTIVD
jgi:predicted transcriptional regulator